MLSVSHAVAFGGAADLARPRGFYEDLLGLTIDSQNGFLVVAVAAGGVTIGISQPSQMVAAPYMALGFLVDDNAGKLAALAARGVAFKRYALMGEAKDAAGIWTVPGGDAKVAWFKDPDGNLLSVSKPGPA
jgi:catechol 2,3-dioxygenase-like lactoylglutathione lyase family enzyme